MIAGNLFLRISLATIVALASFATSDNACSPRSEGDSIVCVCNSTYCDTITRDAVSSGQYVIYTSSKDGQRLNKTKGSLTDADQKSGFFGSLWNSVESVVGAGVAQLTLEPDETYQTIIGFGGAATDASGINWKNLSQASQDNLIRSYCSKDGAEYTILRVPMAACDFSERDYTYNEYPVNDAALTNYSLATEDLTYKIPMIKSCMSVSSSSVKLLASNWGTPLWMQTNSEAGGISRLKKEYYQTYADYHLKFIEEYDKQGLEVWGITTTNEPIDGLVGIVKWNAVGWSPRSQAHWIADNLGPTIRNSRFKDVKIVGLDDQRYTLPTWLELMKVANSSSIDYLDGIGIHWYGDFIAPAALISATHSLFPDKFIIGTEACEGSYPWQINKVELGDWGRAESYIKNIIENLNHYYGGWIDWNLCLNTQGGPNYVENYVDSPIIVLAEKDEFVKQPMFYAMVHFSKFITPDSKRIKVDGAGTNNLEYVAVSTPEGTYVVVVYNKSKGSRNLIITVQNKSIETEIGGYTVKTFEIKI